MSTKAERRQKRRWKKYLKLTEKLGKLPEVSDDRDPQLIREALERFGRG